MLTMDDYKKQVEKFSKEDFIESECAFGYLERYWLQKRIMKSKKMKRKP